MKTKKLTRKLKPFLKSVWERKELWIDAIWMLGIVIMITGIPFIYQQITSTLSRIIMILILLIGLVAMGIFIILRLIRRNKETPLTKIDYIHFVLRGLLVFVCIWIFAGIMARIIHPTLSGIYAIEMTRKEEIGVMLSNSLFFALYSQAILTIFTETGETYSVFLKRLGKTWLLSILPMFFMSLLFTFITQCLSEINIVVSYILSVLLTTFLWVTSIALNEKIKRG